MKHSLLASLGKPLWRLLEDRNIDAAAHFTRHGLDPSTISEPRATYPYIQMAKAWESAGELLDTVNIGLQACEYITPLDLNALGVTFLSSSDLVEAFERAQRYARLLNGNLVIELEQGKNSVEVVTEIPGAPTDTARILEDIRAGVLVTMARMGVSKDMNPVEVAFTHPEPESTGEFFGLFRCPLVFSQPDSRISFSMEDARRPFTDANRELAARTDHFLDEMIAEMSSSDLISRVKRAIMDELPSGAANQDRIAQSVCASSRTLQRRLAEEGVSFRDLVTEVRRELAERYISDKSMPLAEISYMLGFAETSSFSRAFKNWTGQSPAIYRDNCA